MATTTITGSKAGITVGAMCAAMIAVIDISIVNVGLSDIRASFGTPLDQIGWVSVGYMMANVVIIPLTGWLQRRLGTRPYFTASILMFTVASALCGLAWDLPSLVAFRVLQGLGGGAIIPTAQSILLARYPEEEHAMASALFGLGAFTGPLLGPTLGGYLIEVASWHWMFLINVPLGLVAAGLSWRCIEEPGFVPSRAPIDRWGLLLLAVGMASLQYALEEGNRDDWLESPVIAGLLLVAGVCLATFVVHELETESPVVDLRVFQDRSYAAGTGINFLIGIALFSGAYVFSLYCGAVKRYSAKDIGQVFLTAGSVQLVLMPVLGKLGGRLDGRKLVGAGVGVVTVSLWLNSQLTDQTGFWGLALPQMVRACGMALLFIPLSVIALSRLPAAQRGNAAGLFNLTRELGGSIGTAWMGTTLDQRSKTYAAQMSEHIDLTGLLSRWELRGMRGFLAAKLPHPEAGALVLMNLRVQVQALVRAFNDSFRALCFLFVLALALALLLRRPQLGVRIEGAH